MHIMFNVVWLVSILVLCNSLDSKMIYIEVVNIIVIKDNNLVFK